MSNKKSRGVETKLAIFAKANTQKLFKQVLNFILLDFGKQPVVRLEFKTKTKKREIFNNNKREQLTKLRTSNFLAVCSNNNNNSQLPYREGF